MNRPNCGEKPEDGSKCSGSGAFPTNYDGEYTRCDQCHRTLNLGRDGRIPNHNATAPRDYQPASDRNKVL